jgi:DNA processing protein
MNENYALLLLGRCKGIGPIHAKNALNYYRTAAQIFAQPGIDLSQLCGWNATQVAEFKSAPSQYGDLVSRDMAFLESHHIQLLPYYHDSYPLRLKQIIDAPICLYYKGKPALNPSRTLAIVGTRKPSAHSLFLTQQIVEQAQHYGVQIISGLAYGIDITAHRCALKQHISTVGVLAHGLDQMYPKAHLQTAVDMQNEGGILTEMPLFSALHPDLFPRRNRLIAGMSDAVLVIESKRIGGSMSTAQIARSYDRDVFAFPGNPAQGHNSGCNALIKRQVAELVEDFSDIVKAMNWQDVQPGKLKTQTDLFPQFSPEEQTFLQALTGKRLHIDELIQFSGLPLHKITLCALELELKGAIKVLPGKFYQRIA